MRQRIEHRKPSPVALQATEGDEGYFRGLEAHVGRRKRMGELCLWLRRYAGLVDRLLRTFANCSGETP